MPNDQLLQPQLSSVLKHINICRLKLFNTLLYICAPICDNDTRRIY